MGYWPFNGNANDESGNRNDGVLLNGAAFTDGIVNNALILDGIDDYVEVPFSPVLSITGAITITAWIKTSKTTCSGIVSNLKSGAINNSNRNGYIFFCGDCCGSNGSHFSTHLNYSWCPPPCVPISGMVESQTIVTNNAWHHIAVTYDGTKVKAYVNRVVEDSVNYSSGILGNTNPLLIGKDYTACYEHRYFHGILDEIRIYNRALTETEIIALYNEPNSTAPSSSVPSLTPKSSLMLFALLLILASLAISNRKNILKIQ